MDDNGYKTVKELIWDRVNFAILKLQGNSYRYQDICNRQEENWQTVSAILDKLGKDDRLAVIRHYENEVHKFNHEFDAVYLQGIKDCFNLLAFLGVFEAYCEQGKHKETK